MSGLYRIPSELIALLCTFLTTPSLKAFRRTCKAFATIAEEHLFNGFEFKLFPRQNRLKQLEDLAAHPTIAPRLKCLVYQSGVPLEYADYRYWQANVYQRLSQLHDLTSNGMTKKEYLKFHAALQARFTAEMPAKYDLYRWHLDHEAEIMARMASRSALVQIMNSLSQSIPQLKLKLIMSEPRIELQELEEFKPGDGSYDLNRDRDLRERVQIRRANCIVHFTHFLEASIWSSLRVTDLSAINFPHQAFAIDNIHMRDIMIARFYDLDALSIKIGDFPHSDSLSRGNTDEDQYGGRYLAVAGSRFARLLQRLVAPSILRLEFPQGKEGEYSFYIFHLGIISSQPPAWLTSVRTLSLSRINCRYENLRALLIAAKSLTDLTLGHCRLGDNSMIDLLEFLPSLGLKHLSLQGTWDVVRDRGVWHSHGEADFTECAAATTYEGPYLQHGLRFKIEEFARTGGTCPLPKRNVFDVSKVPLTWEQSGDTSWHYIPMNLR